MHVSSLKRHFTAAVGTSDCQCWCVTWWASIRFQSAMCSFNCICTDSLHIEDTRLFSIIDSSWLIGCISCRWPWHLAGTDWRVMWYCLALSLFRVNSCFTQQMSFVPDKDCSSDCSRVCPSSLGSPVPALPGPDLTPLAPSLYCGCCEHQKEPGLLCLFSSFSPGVRLGYFWLLSSVKVNGWK